MQTGQKISEHNARERGRESAYNACYFVLNDHRETVYERIDRRVDKMLAEGLVEEVKALKKMGCTRDLAVSYTHLKEALFCGYWTRQRLPWEPECFVPSWNSRW